MTDWLGKTTYTLDALGRIIETNDFEGKITGYEWNSRNQKVSMTYPDGSVVGNTYDVLSRETELKTTASDGIVILDQALTYDTVGNVASKVETALKNIVTTKSENYDYDAINQLVKVTKDSGRTEQYFYDSLGNRVRKEIFDPTKTNLLSK